MLTTFLAGVKSKQTIGFRPNDWEERAITAAEQATGLTRSELIRRCVETGLASVVAAYFQQHEASVVAFQAIIKERKPSNKKAG